MSVKCTYQVLMKFGEENDALFSNTIGLLRLLLLKANLLLCAVRGKVIPLDVPYIHYTVK